MISFKFITVAGTFFLLASMIQDLASALTRLTVTYSVWIGVCLCLVAFLLRRVFRLAMRHSDYDKVSCFLATVMCGLIMSMAGIFFWLAFTA